MRCEEVIEELAVPSETRDAASLADHLSRCSSCGAWAKRAADLDRLWQATAPTEPASHVWDNLWANVASSLDNQVSKEVASPVLYVSANGSANGSVAGPEREAVHRPRPRSLGFRLWKTIGVAGLAQAAAVLLVAGLGWRFFVPTHSRDHGVIASARSSQAVPRAVDVVRGSLLPDVEIEEGHLVVILADPKNPSVVDRTPKVKVTLDGEDYLYVNLDLDWFATYNRVESLGKPDVAMKE